MQFSVRTPAVLAVLLDSLRSVSDLRGCLPLTLRISFTNATVFPTGCEIGILWSGSVHPIPYEIFVRHKRPRVSWDKNPCLSDSRHGRARTARSRWHWGLDFAA